MNGYSLWLHFSKLKDTKYLLHLSLLQMITHFLGGPLALARRRIFDQLLFLLFYSLYLALFPSSFQDILIALSLSQLKFCDIGCLRADRQIILFPIISALGQVVLRILWPEYLQRDCLLVGIETRSRAVVFTPFHRPRSKVQKGKLICLGLLDVNLPSWYC